MVLRLFIFLIIYVILHITGVAQPVSRQLFTVKSEQPIRIPGTHITITPADGFVVSHGFTGLRNQHSIIEMYDLPGGNVDVLRSDFTTEKYAQQGLIVDKEELVNIDGYQGVMLSVSSRNERSISLLFGDDKFSVIAIATYPDDDVAMGETIRQSLLTMKYGTGAVDALAGAAFHLDDSKAAFRFNRHAANTFYYTPNAKHERETGEYLTVTQLAWDYTTSPAMIGELMLREMAKYGLQNGIIRKESNRKFNGYQAYESEILAKRHGKTCAIYQVVVIHEDWAVVIHGIDGTNSKKNKAEFRKLAQTLRFK